jgi:hypothetical protein
MLRPGLQGIARVTVDDAKAQLIVAFLAPFTSPPQDYMFKPLSYSLTGGQRLFPRILKAEPYSPTSPPGPDGRSVLLTLDGEGDFSIYTLTVNGPDIDPFFRSATLRFRLACDDRFDCRPPAQQRPSQPELPVVIDYLAKDYSSFRQALLDFIPTRLPGWTERNEADIGMMLLELFAATADDLSYMQDRVANEAFLDSATQRRSVAGHLALIGYQMDEGASAHTWLQFQVNASQVLTGDPGFKVSNQPGTSDEPIIVFETLGETTLDPAHNQMSLYDWGNTNCCLPSQAVSAALAGSYGGLKAGDYLLLDDGSGHRDIVRLTAPAEIIPAEQVTSPPISSLPTTSPPSGFITIVTWSATTPLHYDYCVANTLVRGNLAVATHGETISDEPLRSLSDQQKAQINEEIAARQRWQRIPRQRLPLANAPLAHLDPETLALGTPLGATLPLETPDPATAFTTRAPRSISTLQVRVDGVMWQEQPSLPGSLPDAQVFKVEIDDAGEATVVFGDNTFGQRPSETANVTATYRVGGGQVANIGADTLIVPHPLAPAPWLISVTNPLPAVGGRDLESRDHARRVAPPTSRQPLVAVSAADYQAAAAALTNATGQQLIQRANASFRWTGSWLTVTLAVDPFGVEGLTPDLRQALLDFLGARRLTGYDLEITGPVYLPIELQIEFCAAPGARPTDVQQAIQQALSNGQLPGGLKSFFHPDNFTFGDNLHVSKIYAAVMAVPGVESAQITRLARLHAAQPDNETVTNLSQGFLAVGPNQIIRLDNDRNFPQNGTLSVQPKGAG